MGRNCLIEIFDILPIPTADRTSGATLLAINLQKSATSTVMLTLGRLNVGFVLIIPPEPGKLTSRSLAKAKIK
jgi:hypothetical protein